jgi:phage terminase small subunit
MGLPAKTETKSAYDKLPRRMKRFVDQYVIGATGEAAIRAAGYKGLYPYQIAGKWLKKPFIKQAVEEATERHVNDVGVRQATVLKQMKSIATIDPRKLVDENGVQIPLHLLDDATAAAIQSVEIESVSSNGETGTRYKYKFWDKVKANDRLGQFVKLWEQRATNVNVDARSVTLNVDRGSEDAIRALDDIGRQIAALGSGQAPALPNPHGSVLPAALCDGQEGRGTSVDDGADSRGTDPA